MTIFRSLITGVCILAFASTAYAALFGRLTINGTDSLNANAFAMVSWPKILRRGAIVATELPEALQEGFAGLAYTKRIVGLPGDRIIRSGDQICIAETCVKAHRNESGLQLPLWSATLVPPGHIAVLGDSPDSFDSRYEAIGAIPKSDVIAVGLPIAFPHWTEVAACLAE